MDDDWPRAGGAMAARIRAHDWAATPLGPIDRWPERLKAAVDFMLGASALVHVAWGPQRIYLYNDAVAALLGPAHPGALGRPMDRVWTDPEYVRLADLALSGETHRFVDDHYLLPARPDEPEGWFSGAWTPLRGDGGEVAGLMVTAVETTDRVLAERRLHIDGAHAAFVLKLVDTLATLSDPATIREVAAQRTGVHLGAQRAGYVEMEDDAAHATVARDWHAPPLASAAGRHRLADCGEAFLEPLRAGHPVVVEDAAHDPRVGACHDTHWAPLGCRSGIAHPVLDGDRLAGLFVVQAVEPRRWTKDDVRLVADVATRMRDAIARVAADRALRDGNARIRLLSDSMRDLAGLQSTLLSVVPAGVAMVDLDGHVVFANPQMTRFLPTGTVPSRDPGRTWRWRAWDRHGEPVPPDDFPTARALRGEHVVPGLRMLYTDDDGVETWTLVASVPVRDETGAVTGVVTLVKALEGSERATASQG